MLRKSTEASVFFGRGPSPVSPLRYRSPNASGRAQSTRIPNVAQSLVASFDRVDRRRLAADVYHHMDETIFLVVLGAFAILYAAGWLAISLPKGKRR
jgi:hypothetical protein